MTQLSGYPDSEDVGWLRTDQIEYGGLSIGMTITPGERIVQLWELDEAGGPVCWLGNVYRIHAEPPCLRLHHQYEKTLDRRQRDSLARIAANFWNG